MHNRNFSSSSVFKTFFGVFLFFITTRLAQKGLADGASQDFEVFYRATRIWFFEKRIPYLDFVREPGFVFKYPPWSLPFFLPFSLLSFQWSKIFWVLFELFCLGFVLRWLMLWVRVPLKHLIFTVFVFLWILQNHFFWGQITLAFTALFLWSITPHEVSPFRTGFALSIFSFKIHPVFAFFSNLTETTSLLLILRNTALFIAIALTSVFVFSPEVLPQAWITVWIDQILHANSALGLEAIRGVNNHGLIAGVARLIGAGQTTPTLTPIDTFGPWVLLLVLNWGWFIQTRTRFQKKGENFLIRAFGHLALTTISLPLCWDHSFVMVIPLFAWTSSRTLKGLDLRSLLIVLSAFCIGLSGPQIWGENAFFLERFSIKSLGTVLLCGLAYIAVSNPSTQKELTG